MPAELTEPQADALRELTNVAAGHAARALSTLLGGEKFGLWPPLVRLVDAPQLTALLGGRGSRLTSVSAELRGDVGGALALVFTEPHVQTLTSRLLGAAGQRFQTPEVALRDAANLVYSAALDAVVRLSGVRALHSVPVVGEGPGGDDRPDVRARGARLGARGRGVRLSAVGPVPAAPRMSRG